MRVYSSKISMKYILFLVALLVSSCQSVQPITTQKETSMPTTLQSSTPGPVSSVTTEIATLGAGCFWCVETIYQDLQGVLKVESGYSGGRVRNPTYNEVCAGTTGHAEVIQVTFDPAIISFREILEVFFTVHDPTTLNRQGNDIGTQYRSVIYCHSALQKTVAEEVKLASKEIWDNPIVTEIADFDIFYVAEKYHQNYYKDNPNQGYCSIVIAPKVKKFRQKWAHKLKS